MLSSPGRSSGIVVTTTAPALSTPNQQATSHGLFGPAQQHAVARHDPELVDEHVGDLVGRASSSSPYVQRSPVGREQARAVCAVPRDGRVEQLDAAVQPVGVLHVGEVEQRTPASELDRRQVVAAERVDVRRRRELRSRLRSSMTLSIPLP